MASGPDDGVPGGDGAAASGSVSFQCADCGFVPRGLSRSFRRGDLCPECNLGYLERT